MRIQKIITLLLLVCLALPVMAQKKRIKYNPKTERTAPKPKPVPKPKPKPTPTPKPVKPKPVVPAAPDYAGHEYVDLGLPSGLKWATCNIGASSPSDYGNYYAWGETSTKSEYTESNSKTYGKNMGDIGGNSAYDAARANWGGSWRLPTKAEFDELLNRCTWTWTSQNGHNGYMVKGPNGRSIFVPAAGWRFGTSLEYAGEFGYYWSSTPNEGNSNYAYYLNFASGSRDTYGNSRYGGQSVRAVSE